ncbi:MAG: FAD:protein FMN transferase [Ruminococcaceae bacterium]|nr:FAD:protein FMN transferase [Oscillospiraceae bacterium]
MDKHRWRRPLLLACFVLLVAALLVAVAIWRGTAPPAQPPANSAAAQELHTTATFAMDTLVDQQAYGPNAQDAMRAVNLYLASYDARLSLFAENGDIAAINAAAGNGDWVTVAPETAALLGRALALSAQSEGAFAITVAPLTLAWGITTDTPRVPGQDEIDRLLPLVDDAAVETGESRVRLPEAGMALDLGGIAKGAVCTDVAAIYDEYGVDSAWISIGGNIYARGKKPDGSAWRIGFRDPASDGYVASFLLTDRVIAVSGGYERYFEVDGQRYIHIIDPATGHPAESDIASVGAICADGAEADFWSTTLYVWGRERALQQMRNGLCAILLDDEGVLYVSESLRDGFALYDEASGIDVVYVPGS